MDPHGFGISLTKTICGANKEELCDLDVYSQNIRLSRRPIQKWVCSDPLWIIASLVTTALCRFTGDAIKVFTTIASCIRKAFEKSYGRGWNVVVGRSFGAYVTHEIKTYMYFTVVPGVYVLLWRWVSVCSCWLVKLVDQLAQGPRQQPHVTGAKGPLLVNTFILIEQKTAGMWSQFVLARHPTAHDRSFAPPSRPRRA